MGGNRIEVLAPGRDAYAAGTKVLIDGVDIEAFGVSFRVECGQVNEAKILLSAPMIEGDMNAERTTYLMVDPRSGERRVIKSVTFRNEYGLDNSPWEP